MGNGLATYYKTETRRNAYNTTDRYRFGGKELDTHGGLFHYDFDARWYDPVFPQFTTVDPMAEKYPHLSPYAYCAGNPIRYIDPSGEDPIYIEKDGEIILIGDNGKTDQIAYLVQGSVAESVQNSKDKFYTGDLTAGDNVFIVPTGNNMEKVKKTVERSKKSGRENGGHIMMGDNKAILWDEGIKPYAIYDEYKGTKTIRGSVEMFKVQDRIHIPNVSNVLLYWHTHAESVSFPELGNSNPSKGDFDKQDEMKRFGYKGLGLIIGIKSNDVTYYDGKKILKTISLSNFYKIGK